MNLTVLGKALLLGLLVLGLNAYASDDESSTESTTTYDEAPADSSIYDDVPSSDSTYDDGGESDSDGGDS